MRKGVSFASPWCKERAVTLIELLVSAAVLVVLACVGMLAVQSCMRRANLMEEMAAIRVVTQAYLAYAQENNGRLLEGQTSDASRADRLIFPDGQSLKEKTSEGISYLTYSWHLAPYLGWDVDRAMITWSNRKERFFETNYYYAVAAMPAFGLNTYGVGGYQVNSTSGATAPDDLATRLIQIPQPQKMIVFATAAQSPYSGYFYVRPPRMASTWTNPRTGEVHLMNSEEWSRAGYRGNPERFGNVRFSYTGKAIVSFMDGHSELRTPEELRDSRLWNRVAQERDDAEYTAIR